MVLDAFFYRKCGATREDCGAFLQYEKVFMDKRKRKYILKSKISFLFI